MGIVFATSLLRALSPPQNHIFSFLIHSVPRHTIPFFLQLPYRINENINHLAATFTHPSTPCPLTVGLSPPLGAPQHQVGQSALAVTLF